MIRKIKNIFHKIVCKLKVIFKRRIGVEERRERFRKDNIHASSRLGDTVLFRESSPFIGGDNEFMFDRFFKEESQQALIKKGFIIETEIRLFNSSKKRMLEYHFEKDREKAVTYNTSFLGNRRSVVGEKLISTPLLLTEKTLNFKYTPIDWYSLGVIMV